jgi:hypothetical protein
VYSIEFCLALAGRQENGGSIDILSQAEGSAWALLLCIYRAFLGGRFVYSSEIPCWVGRDVGSVEKSRVVVGVQITRHFEIT